MLLPGNVHASYCPNFNCSVLHSDHADQPPHHHYVTFYRTISSGTSSPRSYSLTRSMPFSARGDQGSMRERGGSKPSSCFRWKAMICCCLTNHFFWLNRFMSFFRDGCQSAMKTVNWKHLASYCKNWQKTSMKPICAVRGHADWKGGESGGSGCNQ